MSDEALSVALDTWHTACHEEVSTMVAMQRVVEAIRPLLVAAPSESSASPDYIGAEAEAEIHRWINDVADSDPTLSSASPEPRIYANVDLSDWNSAEDAVYDPPSDPGGSGTLALARSRQTIAAHSSSSPVAARLRDIAEANRAVNGPTARACLAGAVDRSEVGCVDRADPARP